MPALQTTLAPAPTTATGRSEPLTPQDCEILRIQQRVLTLNATLASVFMALLFGMLAMCLGLTYSVATDPDTGGAFALVLLIDALLAGLVVFIGMHALHLPADALRLRRILRRGGHKRIIEGTLQRLESDRIPGVSYVLASQRITVGVPHWNLVGARRMRGGNRPTSALGLLDAEVALHLFELVPGGLPFLLRAEYAGTPTANVTQTPVTDADRAAVTRTVLSVRHFVWGMAAIALLVGIVFTPLLLVAAIMFAISFVPFGLPSLKHIDNKRVVDGMVEEWLTYYIPGRYSGTNHYSIRVGGRLYFLAGTTLDATPGESLTLEFADAGTRGLKPLFAQRPGGPRMVL